MGTEDDKDKGAKDDVDDELDNDELDDDDDTDDDDDDEFGKNFDAKRAKATIQRQRKSERDARKALKRERDLRKAAEAKATAGDDKDSKPDEKLARELKESNERASRAEAALQKATLRSTASEVAAKLGFRNPAKAYRLLDAEDVEFDEDGEPTNLRALLREELRDDPSLKRRKRDDEDDDDDDADAGKGRRQRGGAGSSINDNIRAAAGR